MAEREADIFKLPEEGVEESIDVRRLPHLISGAGASKGSDRTALALEINKVLIKMRQNGHEEAESRILVAALDEHRFDRMVDAEGRSCRKEAVETLVACGFPHALKVAPEDLEFARSWVPPLIGEGEGAAMSAVREARLRGLMWVVGSQLAFALSVLMIGSPGGTAAVLAGLAGFLAVVVSLRLSRAAPDAGNSTYGAALGMLALVQGACALKLGAPALLGAVGLVVGLLASLPKPEPRADPPKPGDWDYTDRNNF